MNKFMKMAIKEAQKGIRNGHGGPFGAVIVKDGVVVGRGHNQVIKIMIQLAMEKLWLFIKHVKNLAHLIYQGVKFTLPENHVQCV